MAHYAYAEIIGIDGNMGVVATREEAIAKLRDVWNESGTWAAAVAAGNADEPMTAVLTIDANGDLYGADGEAVED